MGDDGTGTRRITVSGRSATELLVAGLTVTVAAGPDQGRSASLRGASLRIGTDPSSDLVLSDGSVSREHAVLTRTPEGVLVRDLGSTNGTFIDDVRTREGFVEAGSRLRVGATALEVVAAAESFVVFPDGDEADFHGILGRDPAMQEVFALVRQLARTDLPVTLTAETGCGKELVARALHDAGPRAGKPFLVLDCGAVLPELLPSELFGHEKGAFTGADRQRAGILEAARGGTVFLDEVGELDLKVQPNLLRALESRRVRRVGGHEEIKVDFRVVSATNRNLADEVRDGRFRADLRFRLACVTLRIPPLRERLGDLGLLADAFLERCATRNGLPLPRLSEAARQALASHPWPGNVRELRNVCDALCAFGEGRTLTDQDVLPRLEESGPAAAEDPSAAGGAVPARVGPDSLEAAERAIIARALEETGGNKKAAARKLGISHTTLYRKLERYQLADPGEDS